MTPDEFAQGAEVAGKAINLFPNGEPFSYWQCGKTGINLTHYYVLLLQEDREGIGMKAIASSTN